MQYSSAILVAAFAITNVFAHGVITEVRGANGVNMPGLTVVDGTPRDCPTAGCGAQSDTAIIRANELGTSKASALGRTTGSGPVDPAKMVALFMDGVAGNTTAAKQAREIHAAKRQLFGGGGATSKGVKTPAGTKETGVAAAAGAGASAGLPETNAAGEISMTLHQINQDGAGPFTAMVDPTSGGKDVAAFKTAKVTENVPGIAAGVSLATNMDFPVTMQVPAGMTCSGTVAGVSNVCVAKLQNSAGAGPFGGAIAFTQSAAARKRAIEHNLSKRRFAKMLAKKEIDEEAEINEVIEEYEDEE